jgi:hypothetical protein
LLDFSVLKKLPFPSDADSVVTLHAISMDFFWKESKKSQRYKQVLAAETLPTLAGSIKSGNPHAPILRYSKQKATNQQAQRLEMSSLQVLSIEQTQVRNAWLGKSSVST